MDLIQYLQTSPFRLRGRDGFVAVPASQSVVDLQFRGVGNHAYGSIGQSVVNSTVVAAACRINASTTAVGPCASAFEATRIFPVRWRDGIEYGVGEDSAAIARA